MIDAGDIHLAHLRDEVRRRVLVISNDRFNAMSGRVLVAPEIQVDPDEVPFPWRVQIDNASFALDLLRSLPVDRLLDRVDRAPASTMAAVRRVLLHIA